MEILMKRTTLNTLLVLFIAGIFNSGLTDIIRVPQDYDNLEDGLLAARANDTVLVADGIYRGDENVDLDIDTRVKLISENGPENCIIDGDGIRRSAFTLDDRSRLSGFTIRNFSRSPILIDRKDFWRVTNCIITDISSDRDSVGTKVISSDGVFEYCVFSDMRGIRSGSALYISGGDVQINYCYFINVTADSMGGAIHIRQSADVDFFNCIFRGNESRFVHGGAIAMFNNGTDVKIDFCNFLNNEARNWGGAIYKDRDSMPIIGNSIFWGNSAGVGDNLAAILGNDNRMIRIYNCIVEGGEDVEAGWFGDDLVEERPRYARGRDPIWGFNNYYLDDESPGIDQGSDSAENLDMDVYTTHISLEPDQGTVDIGYHYDLNFYYALGSLNGYVYDIETGDPIERAVVKSSLGQEARTNGSGRYSIIEAYADTIHTLTATYRGYNDSTVFEIELVEGEEISTDFSLYHPLFSIDPVRIIANTDSGDTGRVDITIANSGNGPLEWTTEVELVGNLPNPWTRVATFDVGRQTDFSGINGIAYVGDRMIVTSHGESNVFYTLDMEGAFLDSFNQFGDANLGMYGLTTDGITVWGGVDDTIYNFTTDGELLSTFESPLRRAKYVAWDSDREVLWQCDRLTDLIPSDREGNDPGLEPIDMGSFRLYGLAYWAADPDGFPLYVVARLRDDDNDYIIKVNPETGELWEPFVISTPPGHKANAGCFSISVDPFSTYFFTIGAASDNDGGDKVMMYFVEANSDWMVLDNTEGVVDPDGETVIRLNLFDDGFGYGRYEGLLTIYHNSLNSPAEIPITLNILDVPVIDEPIVPKTTMLQSVHPNPFNSRVTVNFLVRDHNPISLAVYDIAGRVIHQESQARYNVGVNQLSFDATDWGSGVYFVQLSTLTHTQAMKIICLK